MLMLCYVIKKEKIIKRKKSSIEHSDEPPNWIDWRLNDLEK